MDISRCTFCQVIHREVKAQVIMETPEVIVIEDKSPRAPVHLLIIPRIHIPSVNEVDETLTHELGSLFLAAKEISKKYGLDSRGYKLLVNVGRGGG
ncbi:MAG: Purine nucleoside phosphoramidase [Syntrophomonadaceae bacterium]|nr:Purine nucleoside phosphoramidase [Bacillota bacterium]